MKKNISLNLKPKDIPAALLKQAKRLRRYSVLGFMVFVLALYGYQLYTIKLATELETDPASQITVKALKIDQNSLEKIQQLEDQNVNVQALFKSARDNPFETE